MATDKEVQSIWDYEKRKRRYKRTILFIVVGILLSVLVFLCVYIWSIYNKRYTDYGVVHTALNEGNTAVGYVSYGESMIKYSKNGAVAMDKAGNLVWNGSYEMNQPIISISKKAVAIGDKGNTDIVIFDETGVVNTFSTIHNIVDLEVASQGVTAVLMEDKESFYINVYTPDGTEAVDHYINVNDHGYPIDIALSEDGKKFAVSYMNITTGTLVSTVAFYNFSEVGKNESNNLMGAEIFENTVVPSIRFVDKDTISVYKENSLLLYSMIEKPKLLSEIPFEYNIKSVIHNNKYVGVVLDQRELSTNEIIIYDLNGNKAFTKKIDFDYDKIHMTEDEIIMYNETSCVIMKLNGKTKFEYTFSMGIEALYQSNHFNRYYLVTESDILDIELTD